MSQQIHSMIPFDQMSDGQMTSQSDSADPNSHLNFHDILKNCHGQAYDQTVAFVEITDLDKPLRMLSSLTTPVDPPHNIVQSFEGSKVPYQTWPHKTCVLHLYSTGIIDTIQSVLISEAIWAPSEGKTRDERVASVYFLTGLDESGMGLSYKKQAVLKASAIPWNTDSNNHVFLDKQHNTVNLKIDGIWHSLTGVLESVEAFYPKHVNPQIDNYFYAVTSLPSGHGLTGPFSSEARIIRLKMDRASYTPLSFF